jgi:DNA primase
VVDLATRLNVGPPESFRKRAPVDPLKKRREEVLEAFMDKMQTLLWEPDGEKTLAYLRARGYRDEDIRAMGLGHYPGEGKALRIFQEIPGGTDFSRDILLPEWRPSRERYSLAFLYRDENGNPLCLYGRTLEKDPTGRKYLNFSSVTKETPFMMHKATGNPKVYIVEGFLDALFAHARGLNNVISTMGTSITGGMMDCLERSRVKTAVLVLDPDEAGEKGTIRAIEALHAGERIRPFVVSLPEGKDPDELILEHGGEWFRDFLEREAQSGASYRASMGPLSKPHDTPIGMDTVLGELADLRASMKDPRDRKEIQEIIERDLGYDREHTEALLKKRELLKIESRGKEILSEHSRAIREATEAGNLEKAVSILQRTEEELLRNQEKIRKGFSPLWVRLEDKKARDEQREPGAFLGFRLKTFRKFAKDLEGIQRGFYILGAQTNVGKSAFLTNLFADLLQTNPEAHGLYFSLDDPDETIMNRFLGILSGLPLNQVQMRQVKPEDRERLEGAYQTLRGWSQDGRMELLDISQVYEMDQMALAIRDRAMEPGLFVMVDDIHNIGVGDYAGKREENIERANKLKALTDTYGIPTICTAELRKSDNQEPVLADLMETGKFAYNANWVGLLWDKRNGEPQSGESGTFPVYLKTVKNKLSSVKMTRTLLFTPAKGLMTEER